MVAAIGHHDNARKFIFGAYLDEPLAMIDVDTSETIFIKNYYHQNRLYNVAAMTDSSGNVVERYTFSAYGLPLILTGAGTDGTWGTTDDVTATASAIGNPYLYTGQRWDPETENHYYKNRYQRPTLGRFISRDGMEYIDGLNMYQYVAAGPGRYPDPYGYDKLNEVIGNIEYKTSEMIKAKEEMAWREQTDGFDPEHDDYESWQDNYDDNKEWREGYAEDMADLLEDKFDLSEDDAQAITETVIKASEVIAEDAKNLATEGVEAGAAATIKGKIVGAGMGQVVNAVAALDGFAKSPACKAWYKEGMKAIRKAIEDRDPMCCLKLRADATDSASKGGECAIKIAESSSPQMGFLFDDLASYLSRKCKEAAR